MTDHIQARSITLVDRNGKPRIHLDADGLDGFANISLISNSGQHIDLLAQPNGHLVLSFDGAGMKGNVTLSDQGLMIRDADGRHGITAGRFGADASRPPELVVYRDGQTVWRSPT